MYVFLRFFTFFSKSKKHDFLRFLSCCTRFPEQWSRCSSLSYSGLAGVEQALGRMPLQTSMQGDENRSLPSHFLMASLSMVRLKFGGN